MAGAGPFTLAQMMKLIWEDQKLVIQGEGSHSSRKAQIIDEVSHGTNFYVVELVNATGKDLSPQPLIPFVYNMIAIVMLQNRFDPGF